MHAPLEATALAPLLVAGYLLATRARPRSRGRTLAFAAALVLILLVFVTPLEELALTRFLWAHLLQNVVLAEWAPALLVLAVPRELGRRAARFPLFRPLVALPLWIGCYVAWHLPWVYDYALRRPHGLLHVEHLSYLVAGIALWWPIVHGAYSNGAKAAYLFAGFILASPIGLLLALVPRAVYAFYRDAPRQWGVSALTDQQIAGVTMAVEQAVVFFAVFAVYITRFLQDEQLEGAFDEVRAGRT